MRGRVSDSALAPVPVPRCSAVGATDLELRRERLQLDELVVHTLLFRIIVQVLLQLHLVRERGLDRALLHHRRLRRHEVARGAVDRRVARPRENLREYTRARCYSSLTFLVIIGIIHIKEIGEGELQKALV